MNNRVFWGAICLAVAAILGVSAYSDAARRLPQRDGVLIAGHDGVDQQILKVDDTGTAAMGGSVASGATDSGNPVKVGGVNLTTPLTLTNGQRGDMLLDTRQNLKVTIVENDTASVIGTNTGADGVSNGQSFIRTRSWNQNYNGSTWDREFTCSSSAVINVSAAATTELVALTASQVIRVCSFVISGDTLATTATFVYGTGANCGSGQVALTGAMRMPDEGSIALSAENGSLFRTASANALCLTAATGAVTGFVTYAKY
jgi:hypothetical protein